MTERRSVPVTVLAPEVASVDLVQRFAADEDTMLIASGDTLAAAGLLGLLRVGRALVVAPDVTSRTPGCECCQVRLDLIDAVRHVVLRRQPARRLVVVVDRTAVFGHSSTSDDPVGEDPASDVVTAVHTLQADSDVDRLAYLDGLVVQIDACSASTRMASGFGLCDTQTEAALSIADRIVVTGAHLLTPPAGELLDGVLSEINLIGHVVIDQAAEVEDLYGLDAWREAPLSSDRGDVAHTSSDRPKKASPIRAGNDGRNIETVVLSRAGVLDPDQTNAWLDNVVAESPGHILRLQAALLVSSHEQRVCVRGSRSAMRSQPESRSSRRFGSTSQPERGSVVVVVGRDLDRARLSAGFESIQVAP